MIAPDTQALIDALNAQGNKAGTEAAAMIVYLIDAKADMFEALKQERQDNARKAATIDEMCARLNRIGDHLRTLTVYAEGDNDHTPPCDPWPPKAKRGRK